MNKNIKPSDLDAILANKKSIKAGTINFGTQKDFTLYGMREDDYFGNDAYYNDIYDDNYNDKYGDNRVLFEEYIDEIESDLNDINDTLEIFEIKIKPGYNSGFQLYVDEKRDLYFYDDNGEPISDDEYEKMYETEKSKVNNFLVEVAKNHGLYKYSSGWTQHKIVESTIVEEKINNKLDKNSLLKKMKS